MPTDGFPANKISFARIIGIKLCLVLMICPFPTSGFTIPKLHTLPHCSNPFSNCKTLKIGSRTNHRLRSIEPNLLSVQSMLWTGGSNVLALIILREAVAYASIFLYNSWLVSLYSGHARWRLPPNPPPVVGKSYAHPKILRPPIHIHRRRCQCHRSLPLHTSLRSTDPLSPHSQSHAPKSAPAGVDSAVHAVHRTMAPTPPPGTAALRVRSRAHCQPPTYDRS
jgi:hypothetical protein